MKGCELCNREAMMHCESDQASLCWECDAKVHGANFLVARHARALLCQSCHAPTQWRAAGARLSPTVSVCERCAADGKAARDREAVEEPEGGGEEIMEDDEDDVDENDAEEEEEEEEEGDNQVVPWALKNPPPASSSSGDESSSPEMPGSGFLKRMRKTADLALQNDPTCSFSHHNHRAAVPPQRASFSARSATITGSFPPLNDRRSYLLCKASSPSVAGAASHTYTHGDDTAVDLVSSASRSPPI